jgi:hypothetical protein
MERHKQEKRDWSEGELNVQRLNGKGGEERWRENN